MHQEAGNENEKWGDMQYGSPAGPKLGTLRNMVGVLILKLPGHPLPMVSHYSTDVQVAESSQEMQQCAYKGREEEDCWRKNSIYHLQFDIIKKISFANVWGKMDAHTCFVLFCFVFLSQKYTCFGKPYFPEANWSKYVRGCFSSQKIFGWIQALYCCRKHIKQTSLLRLPLSCSPNWYQVATAAI